MRLNNRNYHPVLKEPPIAHALHCWDPDKRLLSYEYNGRNTIAIQFPEEFEIGFRHGSDGNLQSDPFCQCIYVKMEDPGVSGEAVVTFTMSKDAVNMRPNRAEQEQGILAQTGSPLLYGVNGLYDITQDLLIDWWGCEWRWLDEELCPNEKGNLTARLAVKLQNKPWLINLRMAYYRRHLGYRYHQPWKFRPNTKAVAGWCSWEACRRQVSMDDISAASDFFSKTLRDYGMEYIQLDDGFENLPIPFDAQANMEKGWLETNERFPGGHKEVVDCIRANGMEPAIWLNTNIVNTDFVNNHPEWFVKDREDQMLLGEWIDYIMTCDEDMLEEQVVPIYQHLRKLDYTYFKIDALRHLIMDGLQEAVRQGVMTNDDAATRFRRYMECARKGMGNDAYFLASWGVLGEAVGTADACRIAMDANPTWAGIRMQLVESARWFHTQRILFLNDPDHVCCRTEVEWLKSVLSLVSLSGSLLMLSDPLSEYTEERLGIIRRVMPPLDTRTAETGPLDLRYPPFTWTKLHGFAVNSKEKPVEAEGISLTDALDMAGNYPTMDNAHPFSTLWAFHMAIPGRRWTVVGRFATVPLEISTVLLENLGLDPQKKYVAFDFWKSCYLGIVSGSLPCQKLELGNCQIIALTPLSDHPQLIASSRHVSMDAVSVKRHDWTGCELQLELEGVEGTKETYWFYVPQGYTHPEQNNDILAVEVDFVQRQKKLTISFDKKSEETKREYY